MKARTSSRENTVRTQLHLESMESRVVPASDVFTAQISDLYLIALQREPDPAGLSHFQGLMEQGVPLKKVAQAILESNEAHEKLVAVWYKHVLDREPDPQGFRAQVEAANRGVPYDRLLASFFGSAEYGKGLNNAAFVQSLYRDVLGREADEAGLMAHVRALNSGLDRESLAHEILESAELASKGAEALYRRILNREASATEIASWAAQLQKPGFDFLDGLLQFVSGPEGEKILADPSLTFSPLSGAGFGEQLRIFGLGDGLAGPGAVGSIDQMSEVQKLVNQIRAVETFSNPDNPGQIVGALKPNHFPDPNAANDPRAKTTGTLGLDAYPGDLRNTPGAFQIDLANLNRVFGIWKGTARSPKNSSPFDTQFAFSQKALATYFGVTVNADGLITQASSAASSIFLHNESIALDPAWDPSANPLIGQHIDNFQTEQLSLLLAGRSPMDSNIRMDLNPRKAPDSLVAMDAAIQGQAARNFIWSNFNTYKTFDLYKDTFAKAEKLFGSTMRITASSTAFGIRKGETFLCEFNPGFIIGGGYVRGFNTGGMFDIVKTVVAADELGSASYVDEATRVTITITKSIAPGGGKIFSVDKTPINVSDEYPSIFHYAAAVSPFKVDMLHATDWNIDEDAFSLGYAQTQTLLQVADSTTLPVGNGPYLVTYSGLADGKTLAATGADVYRIGVMESKGTQPVKVDSSGYNANPANNSQSVVSGQQIDMSDFGTTLEQAYPNFFYVFAADDGTGTYVDKVVHVSDSNVPSGIPLRIYYLPAAEGSVSAAQAAVTSGDFSSFSRFFHSYRVNVADRSVLGTPTGPESWASVFIMTPPPPPTPGSGVIDASASTGSLHITVDQSIRKVELGSGTNTLIAGSAPGAATFALNAGMEPGKTNTVLAGFKPDTDKISLEHFSQVSGIAVHTQSAFDNLSGTSTATKTLYPQFSYSILVSFTAESAGVSRSYRFLVLTRGDNEISSSDLENKILASIVSA